MTATLPAPLDTLPAPQRHIAAAVFEAVFARATAPRADGERLRDFVTACNAAGWRAATSAGNSDAGQGAGFHHHVVRAAIALGADAARLQRGTP